MIPQEYHSAPAFQILSKALTGLQYTLLLCVVIGFQTIRNHSFIRMLRGEDASTPPSPAPQWMMIIEGNKMPVLFGLFFAGNVLSLGSSRPFEVFMNGDLVFSALESGTTPTTSLLLDLLKTHGFDLKMDD